ncbi:hypothetical protein V8G54_028485 [Vigna mungo]|uniref:Uncharacterized protein n=1 Tax=Vigna mungo TaxID=3915 RepID=A0AAQ3MT26_VIGMU
MGGSIFTHFLLLPSTSSPSLSTLFPSKFNDSVPFTLFCNQFPSKVSTSSPSQFSHPRRHSLLVVNVVQESTELGGYVIGFSENDFTTKHLEDGARSSKWVSAFLFGQTLSVISPDVSYASSSMKINELYERTRPICQRVAGHSSSRPLLTYQRRNTTTQHHLAQVHGPFQDNSLDVDPVQAPLRRSSRIGKPPERYICSMTATLSSIPIPSSYKPAMKNECWQKAIESEFLALEENQTWDIVPLMLRRKFYPAATKYLLQAIEKWDGDNPDLAQVYNALGVSYVRDGKVDKGIAQFETAVKLQPGYVTAWNNLGDAYDSKKDYKSALKAFEEVLLFDPNNKVARPRRDSLKGLVEAAKGVTVTKSTEKK